MLVFSELEEHSLHRQLEMAVQLLQTLPRPKEHTKFCLMDFEGWPPSINLQLAYVGEPNRAWLGTVVTRANSL